MKSQEIKPGDWFEGEDGGAVYTVEEVKVQDDGAVLATVRWSDGGLGGRWFDPDKEVPLRRDKPGCYSDHHEDIRTKGSCDYCGGTE